MSLSEVFIGAGAVVGLFGGAMLAGGVNPYTEPYRPFKHVLICVALIMGGMVSCSVGGELMTPEEVRQLTHP